MIRLVNVLKIYPPDQIAIKDLTLQISAGDFVFLAGSSGAGKSTLLKLLFAAEKANQGQVIVGGRDLSLLPEIAVPDFRREVGVIFQDYKLLTRRSVIDNVTFALETKGISSEERRSVGMSILRSLGLESKADHHPLQLSGGEQQRVAVARSLLHKPKLILADEPTGNLDPDMSNTVFDLLLEANALGVTVVVATHNHAIIEQLNLRTIVLDQGRVVGDYSNPKGY